MSSFATVIPVLVNFADISRQSETRELLFLKSISYYRLHLLDCISCMMIWIQFFILNIICCPFFCSFLPEKSILKNFGEISVKVRKAADLQNIPASTLPEVYFIPKHCQAFTI